MRRVLAVFRCSISASPSFGWGDAFFLIRSGNRSRHVTRRDANLLVSAHDMPVSFCLLPLPAIDAPRTDTPRAVNISGRMKKPDNANLAPALSNNLQVALSPAISTVFSTASGSSRETRFHLLG